MNVSQDHMPSGEQDAGGVPYGEQFSSFINLNVVGEKLEAFDTLSFLNKIKSNANSSSTSAELMIWLLESIDEMPSAESIKRKTLFAEAMSVISQNSAAINTLAFRKQYGPILGIDSNTTIMKPEKATAYMSQAVLFRDKVVRELSNLQKAYEQEYYKYDHGGNFVPNIQNIAMLRSQTQQYVETDPILKFTNRLIGSTNSDKELGHALNLDRFIRFMILTFITEQQEARQAQ